MHYLCVHNNTVCGECRCCNSYCHSYNFELRIAFFFKQTDNLTLGSRGPREQRVKAKSETDREGEREREREMERERERGEK